MDEHKDPFIEGLLQLERDLGLPRAFLAKLFHESDWSFVIKAHSLMEAALSSLVTHALRDPRVDGIIRRLDTSNATTGKLAFVKALELLPEPRHKFIQKFSELRNGLVHEVSNAGFTFDDYLEGLDKNQRQMFVRTFSYKVRPSKDAPMDDWAEQASTNPKFSIFMNLVLMLAEAYSKKLTFRVDDAEESELDEFDEGDDGR